MSEHTKKSKYKAKYIKYLKSWEEDSRLKNWIAPLNDNEKAAYCKACRRPFHPQKKVLLLHAKTKKHCEKMRLYEQIMNSHQPFNEMAQELDDSDVKEMGTGTENICVNVDGGPFEKEAAFLQIQVPNLDDSAVENYLSGKEINFEHLNCTTSSNLEDDMPRPLTKSEILSWKNITELKSWINITDNNGIECIVCNKEMKPRKLDLLRHASNKSHVKKLNKMKQSSQHNVLVHDKSANNLSASISYSLPCMPEEIKSIDMRSDTVSMPSKDMKDAMLNTELGDDYFESDPTVKSFEDRICSLLGKESSILFPSGTMSNLVAVMTHCWNRDSEVIAGDQSFLYKYSQSSLAKFYSIGMRPLKNNRDGTFSLEALKELLKEFGDNNCPLQTLVCIENTHTNLGGRALPAVWLEQLRILCSEYGACVHMDGARLMNASVATGTSLSNLVRVCDSTTFCLNKGLGAPMGSMLIGEKTFIYRAKSIRQMLGGTIHQSGLLAAAGLFALDHNCHRLSWDHSNARIIATAVRDIYSTAVRVELSDVQTNIIHFYTDNIRVNSHELCDRLASVKDTENFGTQKVKLHLKPLSNSVVRLVTHCGLSKYDIVMATKKLQHVIKEYDNMLQIGGDNNYNHT